MTDVEKQADAIVHAVVAVELLHWHGKLGGTLENAFRKRGNPARWLDQTSAVPKKGSQYMGWIRCVYAPALPRREKKPIQKWIDKSQSSQFGISQFGFSHFFWCSFYGICWCTMNILVHILRFLAGCSG